jgi:biotin carboxylase
LLIRHCDRPDDVPAGSPETDKEQRVQRVLLVNTGKSDVVSRLEAADDLEVVVLTEPRNAGLYSPSTTVEVVDDLDDLGAVRSAALAVMRGGGIDRIIAPSERSVLPGAYLRSVLGLPGAGFDVSQRFTNKLAMKRALHAAGIPIPRYMAVYSLDALRAAAEQIGWPVVVKPGIGTGAHLTTAVSSPEELAELLDSPEAGLLAHRAARGPLLVEECVAMDAEYHCDGVVEAGRSRFVAASRYFIPLLGALHEFTGSYVLPSDGAEGRALTRIHDRVVAALGLEEGVTHLEVFGVDGRFLVSEIACRPGGGGIQKTLWHQYGVDLWNAFLNVSLGRAPDLAVRERPGLMANCDLPLRPGTVTSISEPGDFVGVPGLVDVTMYHRVGDVISRSWYDSSAAAGVVYFRVDSPGDVPERVAELGRRFTLRVAPIDAPNGAQTAG